MSTELQSQQAGIETTGELIDALAKAQAHMHAPPRNRNVTVRTQAGASYTFAYATLDAIIEGFRKPLTDNGLWFTQAIGEREGRAVLETILWHKSGQSVRSILPIMSPLGVKAQEFGSALTYMRRYALTAMLGIAADEDDDGNAADGNAATQTPRTAARPRTATKAVPGASVAQPEAIPPPAPHPTPKRGSLIKVLQQLVASQKLPFSMTLPDATGTRNRDGLVRQHLGLEIGWSALNEDQCASLRDKLADFYLSESAS